MPPHRWHPADSIRRWYAQDSSSSLSMCALGAHARWMLERWHRSILSTIGPLAYAMVVGRASRRQLMAWAETLEGVAAEMRSKAGG